MQVLSVRPHNKPGRSSLRAPYQRSPQRGPPAAAADRLAAMQRSWGVRTAHFPGAAGVLGQQLLLVFHAASLLQLARQQLPNLQPLELHAQQQDFNAQGPPGGRPSYGGASLPPLPGGAPGAPDATDGGVRESLVASGDLKRPLHAAPRAAAAAAAEENGRPPPRARAARGGSMALSRTAGGAGGPPPSLGLGPPASGSANVGTAGLLLLVGGWGVAALLLLSPLGCLPFVRLCRAANHNRAGVGEQQGPGGGPRPSSCIVLEGGAPHELPQRDGCWGPPCQNGVYVPSLLNEVLPECLLMMLAAPLVAFLAWGEYGALWAFAAAVGPPASLPLEGKGGGPGAPLAGWAMTCPPWQLSLVCVSAAVLGFGLITQYPASSFCLWCTLAGLLGALGAPLLLGGFPPHAAPGTASLLRALPPSLVTAAAAACLAGGLCCFWQSRRMRGGLTKLELLLHGLRILCCFLASLMLLCCCSPPPLHSSSSSSSSRGGSLYEGWVFIPSDVGASAAVLGASLVCLVASMGLFFCSAKWGPPKARRDIRFCRGFAAPTEQQQQQQQLLQHLGQARAIQLASLGPLDTEGLANSSSSTAGVLGHTQLPGGALYPAEGPRVPSGGPLSQAASSLLESVRGAFTRRSSSRGP
ncbi:hypothetical protein Efla_006485 [Eimeria flavescens]